MLNTYYKYKQEVDNMTTEEFVSNLRKTKLYAALDEIMAGKKYNEAKKNVSLHKLDLKLLDIHHGLSYVINPNKKHPKKKISNKDQSQLEHDNFYVKEHGDKRPKRKIRSGEIDVNEITVDSIKNSIK